MSTKKRFDTFLFMPAFILIALGVVMVFSASSPTAAIDKSCNYDPYFFLKRHLAWLGIGVLFMIFAFKIDLKKWRKHSIGILILAIGLLAMVLHPAFSREVLGARRSLVFGLLTFQPSEFAKLALIWYFADTLARRKEKVSRIKYLIIPLLIFGATAYLIEKEPDLGTTLVVSGTAIGMFYMAGANIWFLITICVSSFFAAVQRIISESYRMERMLAFTDPWKYSSSYGYQIIQSLLALGSGGLFGMGIGESRQKFFYLPEKFTDFIFAIIGEELGLLYGTLPVVLLFIIFFYKGIRVAANTRDPFCSLLAGGITFQIVLQAFINMGVVSGLLPCTGIPLPFISFGGSSLLFTMISLGLLLNVAGEPKSNPEEEKSRELSRRPRFTSSNSIAGTIPIIKVP